MLNKLFGTKIKVISGYKGGNEVYLAMERGEVRWPLRLAGFLDQFDAARLVPAEEGVGAGADRTRTRSAISRCRRR